MKKVKLTLATFLIAVLSTSTFAAQDMSKAIIQKVSDEKVRVKAEICDLDEMRVEIKNANGDIVLDDNLVNVYGFASKTYDFSDTKIGEYTIRVYCNEKLIETTIIGDSSVERNTSYQLVLN